MIVYCLHRQTGLFTAWGRWISSRNRTNEYHLPQNRRERKKLVSKMDLMKWNTDFLLEYSDRENWTMLILRTLCCSRKFFTDTTRKVVFHFLSTLILGNLFVDGKQNSMSNSTQRQFSFKSVRDPVLFYPISYNYFLQTRPRATRKVPLGKKINKIIGGFAAITVKHKDFTRCNLIAMAACGYYLCPTTVNGRFTATIIGTESGGNDLTCNRRP